MRRLGLCLFVLAVLCLPTAFAHASSDVVPPASKGCPLFHCTPEATGVMYQPVIKPTSAVSYPDFGKLQAQGCSGNIYRLACLFGTDTSTAPGTVGILKVFDAATMGVLWASGSVTGSYDPVTKTVSQGQVPYFFANGDISAGDGNYQVRYASDGTIRTTAAGVVSKVQLGSTASNMGLTPLADDYGVVSQTDGTLTLIRFSTWEKLSVLQVKEPQTGYKVSLASPSSGTNGLIYVVGVTSRQNGSRGWLFAVAMAPDSTGKQTLTLRASYGFKGSTGASPVAVTPAISGLEDQVVLLHVPGLTSEEVATNHLLALRLKDNALGVLWDVPVTKALNVAPVIDQIGGLVYFNLSSDIYLYAVNMRDGKNPSDGSATPLAFNMQAIGGFPSRGFKLNGHILSTQVDNKFTLLLSGSQSSRDSTLAGQYVFAYQPLVNPSELLWKLRSSATADTYTAAWALAPSSDPNLFRAVVIGSTSGINLLKE